MLVRFSVENFLSYRDKQAFSMMAGKQTKHPDHVLNINDKRILKGSIFFGANASGKSNLIKAVAFAKSVIERGVKENTLTAMHYRIDKSYASKPGVFQFDFYSNGHFYSYGFALRYDEGRIVEEWLYLCDKNDLAVFERNGEAVTTACKFKSLESKQQFDVFSKSISDDKLLLTEISERKLVRDDDFRAYKDVSEWFKKLIVIMPESEFVDKISFFANDDNKKYERLLGNFDTGITKIKVEKEDIDEVLSLIPADQRTKVRIKIENALNDTSEEYNELILNIKNKSLRVYKEDNLLKVKELLISHGNDEDPFNLSDESDGTVRLFDLIPIFYTALQPCVILVDELDRSFHTMLVRSFINYFYRYTKGVASQLIATVHDTNVMDLELLRQDEIWFVERNNDHSSSVYSLNKFNVRFDKKVFRDYILGRYGAIPCLDQIDLDAEGE